MLILCHKTTELAKVFYSAHAAKKERLFIPRIESQGLSSPTLGKRLFLTYVLMLGGRVSLGGSVARKSFMKR